MTFAQPSNPPTAAPTPLGNSALSPCCGVCKIDASTGWCLGCLRTLDEIACWGQLSEAERWDMLRTLKARKATGARLERRLR